MDVIRLVRMCLILSLVEISACYGSDLTEHALQDRCRKLNVQVGIIQMGRAQNLDMA